MPYGRCTLDHSLKNHEPHRPAIVVDKSSVEASEDSDPVSLQGVDRSTKIPWGREVSLNQNTTYYSARGHHSQPLGAKSWDVGGRLSTVPCFESER